VTLRSLIVDDEPLARRRLRSMLSRQEDVELVGEAGDGPSAAARLMEVRPDVVFLDIRIPELDGFALLDALGEVRPAVVFVTAHDEYALRAFDVNALDYLLKPFDENRLREAVRRARAALSAPPLRRLALRTDGRMTLLDVDAVDWVEAADNYVCVHAGGATHVVRGTLAELAARLDPRRFARVHRSTLVNIERIREVLPDGRDFAVVLRDGTRLALARGRHRRLRELLAG
jgi:two-component system, LytTR family, response regulator